MGMPHMINGMVVVPLEASRLAVGIVVVLELPRGREILCPAIPRSTLGEMSVSAYMRELNDLQSKSHAGEQRWPSWRC